MIPDNKKIQKAADRLRMIAEDVAPIRSARISAAILSGGKIISCGACSRESNPLQQRFSRNENAIYEHAEICAIKNALRRYSPSMLVGSTLIVVRRKYNKDMEWVDGLAKPCCGCEKAISYFGIGHVFFTEDEE